MIYVLIVIMFTTTSVAAADVIGPAYVTDGDTIKINTTKVRLNGIDAPESKQNCEKRRVKWHCGAKAAKTLRRLTRGKRVRCEGNNKDRYGRLIANCFADGVNLNAAMVEAGMALAYRKYSKKYVPDEDKARKAKRGLWSGKFVAPSDWRKGKRLDQLDARNCCKTCKKYKACGDSCVKRSNSCKKPPGCACDAN